MGRHLRYTYDQWFNDLRHQPVLFAVYLLVGASVFTGFALISLFVYGAYTGIESPKVIGAWTGLVFTACFISYFGKLVIESLNRLTKR